MPELFVDLIGEFVAEGENAVGYDFSAEDEVVWLPTSQIEKVEPMGNGVFTVTIPEWLALERGLI